MDALNGVLRGMIKEVVEAAMGAELTDFPGYEKNKSPEWLDPFLTQWHQ